MISPEARIGGAWAGATALLRAELELLAQAIGVERMEAGDSEEDAASIEELELEARALGFQLPMLSAAAEQISRLRALALIGDGELEEVAG